MKRLIVFVAVVLVAYEMQAKSVAMAVTQEGYTWYIYNDKIMNPDDYSYGGWTYNTAITPNPTGLLQIPSNIGGTTMKGLGKRAFSGCNMTGVIIPDSIQEIQESVFSNCKSLTSVTVPSSVTYLGERAFENCTSLTNVTFQSVVSIRNFAFYGCTSLSKVFFPSNINTVSISKSAFSRNVTLEPEPKEGFLFRGWKDSQGTVEMTFPGLSNKYYNVSPIWKKLIPISFESNGGVGHMEEELVAEGDDFVIPITQFSKEGYVFSGWSITEDGNVSYLNGSTIPNVSGGANERVCLYAVWKKIDSVSVDGCVWTYSSLPDASVAIGDGLTNAIIISSSADVLVPSELDGHPVTGIAMNAFKGCGEIATLTIPNSVTSVGIGAFDGCLGLTNLIIETETLIMPGLMQTKFDTRFDTTAPLYVASNAAPVSGVISAYQKVMESPWEFSDPLTGRVYAWNESYSTMAYFGQMHMEGGQTYVFGTHFDDDAYVKVDGHVLVNVKDVDVSNTGADEIETHSSIFTGEYLPATSGWYDVEFRFGDINGGKGSWGRIWGLNFGFGYRADGDTSTTQNEWNRLLDMGDGALFRFKGVVFAGCSNLISVTMPWSLVSRMSLMFPDAYGRLESVTLTGDVAEIPEMAFTGCVNLECIILPSEIKTLRVGTSAFDAATEAIIADKNGYVFCGWTNAIGAIIADPFHSATANTVSPWWKKTVTVAFDANGGTGTMAEQMVLEGDNLTLAENRFARAGYLFLGWAESANGTVAFANGAMISGIDAATDGAVLYAVWKPSAPILTPSVGTTFPNASQTMTISCPASDATILYTTDGSDPAVNGNEYKGPFSVYESCTVRAIAQKEGLVDSEEASITLTRAEGLSEAANLYGYLMETDGTYPWTVVTGVSHDGVSCVKSGAIGNGGMTWLQTSLKKAGTVSFWWKAACEEPDVEDGEDGYYDYGAFLVDGNVAARLAGNDTGWQFFSTNITSGGKHVLRWEYSKDGATTYAPDCVWLDQVQWIPADGGGYTLTTPEPVPYAWLSGYGLGGDSDFETAAKGATGKRGGDGRALQVWQDYVAGTDPTNAASVFTAGIEMVGGVPQVTWTPNLNTNGVVRSYTIWGKESLTDAAWHSPTNAADRFFKVSLEMP